MDSGSRHPIPLAKGRNACLLQPPCVFGFIATGQKEVGQNLRAKPEKSKPSSETNCWFFGVGGYTTPGDSEFNKPL